MEREQVRSYRDLKVWQDAMTLAQACYELTRSFPREEMYGMTSQIRRSAVSIAANIAEGYDRDSRGNFVQFLRNAQGSLKELETHLLLAGRVRLTPVVESEVLLERCDSLGKMLRSLIRTLQNKGDA